VPQILFDHAGASGTILAWEPAIEAARRLGDRWRWRLLWI